MPKSLLKQNLSSVLVLFSTNSRGDSIPSLAGSCPVSQLCRQWMLPDGACALANHKMSSLLPSSINVSYDYVNIKPVRQGFLIAF